MRYKALTDGAKPDRQKTRWSQTAIRIRMDEVRMCKVSSSCYEHDVSSHYYPIQHDVLG